MQRCPAVAQNVTASFHISRPPLLITHTCIMHQQQILIVANTNKAGLVCLSQIVQSFKWVLDNLIIGLIYMKLLTQPLCTL